MTQTAVSTQSSRLPAAREPIRPFRVNVSDEALADLRRRVAATRFPEKETVADNSQGVPLAAVQALARYWANEYDWRRCEAKLNSFPQFLTMIDGLAIHFIHVRSKHPNALPAIITHGWPGSIIEKLKIIVPLTNPTANGGHAEDAFDVVIPSIPGYGFSGKPTSTGWDPARIGRAWAVLMQRLGYERYVAQGTDFGAIITDVMAAQGHSGLIGIHLNLPGTVPPDIDKALWSGSPLPDGLSAEEKVACDMLASAYKNVQYAICMASRPQTLIGLSDSPVGMATWMFDPGPRSLNLIARGFAGEPTGLTLDDILDSSTLFWLTNTGVSAARLYWENKFNYFAPKNVTIPVAVSIFPDEIYQAPRSWAERAYPNLLHYNRVEKGGHFPAWQQPGIFTSELQAAFRSLRSSQRAAP